MVGHIARGMGSFFSSSIHSNANTINENIKSEKDEAHHPACMRFASVTASDILRALDLEPLPDSGVQSGISHCSTDNPCDTISIDSNNDSPYNMDINELENTVVAKLENTVAAYKQPAAGLAESIRKVK